ncbi:MAG: DUF1294 domain-containing protein [Candidatus Komeilibacteria bacterium CG10_big_fil_rev_8_21_14_0_10_41_13]|uniref:DUF1294 domain-containing protein n=1 Tax=Candidatus Komeilibacteria bacterium CG10_big_fil_rev_8_21_14_0_10_41_13 TaxID=1974476 RepID=A0A2M6WCT5_9BACT|nr:MAG: DUF1294 domain-containing protein [Candidatus Komeilibacteria bacterium CG10_big_fil_rev_8_21_14_0_10_41_13]
MAIIIFLIINIISFIYIALDKSRSIKNNDRTPEGVLFFLAICFGALGIWLGMYAFRHKIRKWYFVLGVPIILIQNILTVWLIIELINKNLTI